MAWGERERSHNKYFQTRVFTSREARQFKYCYSLTSYKAGVRCNIRNVQLCLDCGYDEGGIYCWTLDPVYRRCDYCFEHKLSIELENMHWRWRVKGKGIYHARQCAYFISEESVPYSRFCSRQPIWVCSDYELPEDKLVKALNIDSDPDFD